MGTVIFSAFVFLVGRKPPSCCLLSSRYLISGSRGRDGKSGAAKRRHPRAAARKAVAELAQRFVVEFLLLVGALLAAPMAHAVALLGLGEDHRGLALVVRGGVVCGVDLHRVVPAPAQAVDVVVTHVGDELAQLRVLVEEVLAVEAAVGGGVHLELAVHGLVQALEDPVLVAREERVPVRAPKGLITFQPAPANEPSSSCTIEPLPRTGPSRRCRLQFTTKMRLSRPSRVASESPASDSGSSISPSPQTPRLSGPAFQERPRCSGSA